jgi:hypothetical protein
VRTLIRQGLIRATHDLSKEARADLWREVQPIIARVFEAVKGTHPSHAQLAIASTLVELSAREGFTLVQVQQLVADLWAAASKEGT